MKKLAVALTSLAFAGALGACGGDDDSSSSGGGDSGGGGGGNVVEVGMKGNAYTPMDVTVPAGGTVKWTNTDTPSHTVTKEDGPGEEFDSGTMSPGDEFEQKFADPGKVNYVCEIHPFQKGTVTVE